MKVTQGGPDVAGPDLFDPDFAPSEAEDDNDAPVTLQDKSKRKGVPSTPSVSRASTRNCKKAKTDVNGTEDLAQKAANQPNTQAAIEECFQLLMGLTSKIPKHWGTAVNRETYLRSLEAIPNLFQAHEKCGGLPVFTPEIALDYAGFIHSCIFMPISLTAMGGKFETYRPKTAMLRNLLRLHDESTTTSGNLSWDGGEAEDTLFAPDSEPERESARSMVKANGRRA
ncbi:hypothetical protein PYCCODRAFT_1427793 [Trametes coccinea BRFM310]|uniref:Uncharacterized protein n=1 Tax=Trametes coccinea (strain BRFM310) TaxID=1353009 RepID=A0A1Y2IBN1_TRAC3|nr:hypothetical protein PYCCODRAFT_1427793 [Trametes coccinea BRFM310]